MLYLPDELNLALKEQFLFPQGYLFGSVATLDGLHPKTRTMRIYDLNQEGCPILLTHTMSNKWQEFVKHPHVSISLISENKLMQIIVLGTLNLDTLQSTPEKARYYWDMVRSDVKKIYDPKHAIEKAYSERDDLSIPQDVPDTFGIACVVPSFWELLHLNAEYTKSRRYQFHLKNGHWQRQRINVG